MPLAFRNIDASPADPVQSWPFEGVLAALERGGLDEWRRLAQAIAADPWGQVARYVEQAVDITHPYGVSQVMTGLIAEARKDAELAERTQVAATVRELISDSGLTQARFAADLGTSASRLSTYVTGSVVPSAALLVRMRRVATAHGQLSTTTTRG
jgi:predicted XRE-type DNA-binding protein